MISVLQAMQVISIVICLCAIVFAVVFFRRMHRGDPGSEKGFFYSNAVVTTAATSAATLWLAMAMGIIWIYPVSLGFTIGFFTFLSYRIRQRWAFDERL